MNSNCHLCLALLFSLRRFCLASFRSSWLAESPDFTKFLTASFLTEISSIRHFLKAVNQLGLLIMTCSEASFVAHHRILWLLIGDLWI